MKAAIFEEHGSVDKLKISKVDTPTYNEDEVLISVKAFALNRLDLWTREGLPSLDLDFPHVGGSDFSGVIKEKGKNVTEFEIGDRVAVNPGISCGKCLRCKSGKQSLCEDFHLLGEHVWGGAAEFAVTPTSNLIRLPDHISHVDAAAVTLTALTAYRMIHTRARLQPGQTVLVIGSGGGIGSIAVQIAKVLGAKVIAITSTEEKVEKAKSLGAEFVINYKEDQEWSKTIWKYTNKKGVDIVIDSVGEAVFKNAVRSLGKGGRYVTCGATSGRSGKINLALLFWKQLSILGSTMSTNKEFHEVMQLFFDGRIKPVIDSQYSIDEIKQAHERMESGKHIGKIVLTL